jgi:hypothetical protein
MLRENTSIQSIPSQASRITVNFARIYPIPLDGFSLWIILPGMDDWLKIAKQRQLDEYLDSFKREDEIVLRTEEMREAEKNWIERVQKRVDEINAEGFFIRTSIKEGVLKLTNKGEAEIQLLEPACFAITYKNILPATTHILSAPVLVHHHRIVKVRKLNSHNIEEVMKFVVLGMKKYSQIAQISRIEHNLQEMISIVKKDEHERMG